MRPFRFYEINGLRPVAHPSAFVHPCAAVVGDVFIGENVFVGPFASLRGDFGRLTLAAGCNVQDGCILHAFPGEDVAVEENGHIGHGAILHGCRVEKNAMVGIGAVVLDGAVVGESAIVGANALVTAGFVVPPRALVLGSPAKIKRQLTEEEMQWKHSGTAAYHRLTARCRDSLRPCEALRRAEPGRRRIEEMLPEEAAVVPKKAR